MAERKGRISIKPEHGGSISIGMLLDSDNREKVVITIRDDNTEHDFGVCILEEWEVEIVASALKLSQNGIYDRILNSEPLFVMGEKAPEEEPPF